MTARLAHRDMLKGQSKYATFNGKQQLDPEVSWN